MTRLTFAELDWLLVVLSSEWEVDPHSRTLDTEEKVTAFNKLIGDLHGRIEEVVARAGDIPLAILGSPSVDRPLPARKPVSLVLTYRDLRALRDAVFRSVPRSSGRRSKNYPQVLLDHEDMQRRLYSKLYEVVEELEKEHAAELKLPQDE